MDGADMLGAQRGKKVSKEVITKKGFKGSFSNAGSSAKGWVCFLNRGSQIEVDYTEKLLVVFNQYKFCNLQGWVCFLNRGSQIEVDYTEKPPVHSTELPWHLVHGSGGTIEKTVDYSAEYYITVQNKNDNDTTVLLDFRIRAVLYDTAGADYACSPRGSSVCKYRLPIHGHNVAVLSSGFRQRPNSDEEQHVTVILSYEPRWIVYVVGLGKMLS